MIYWVVTELLMRYVFSIVFGRLYTAMHSLTDCAIGVGYGSGDLVGARWLLGPWGRCTSGRDCREVRNNLYAKSEGRITFKKNRMNPNPKISLLTRLEEFRTLNDQDDKLFLRSHDPDLALKDANRVFTPQMRTPN
jgi:hypothetical protein